LAAPATATARSARAVSTSAIVATLCLSGTVVALQQTLVVPLLPDFPEILGTTTDNASWLVTSTLLVGAVATPIVSRLADMIGKRRMMVVCMLVMVAGSVIAALRPNFALVVTGRALQGFAAALIPVGISILRDELPREKVPSAVALMSATLGIGGGIGLPASGLIYDHLGWQAIFWGSAAIGVALIVAVLAIVPESAIRTRGRFDYLGAVLLSIALTSLLLAISKGGTWGWTSERTLGLFLVALVVLVVWVPFELRVSQPMVDIRTSTRRPVLLTNIASLLVGFAMFGNLLATTQQLQLPVSTGYGFGTTVVVAGLYMLPSSLAMVVFAPVSAGITRRSGAKTTLIIGCVLLAAGYVARVFLTTAIWQVVLGATIVSVGTAIGYAAMPTLIMRAVPITETASANGLNTLLRAVGTSTSSAAVAAALSSVTIDVGGATLPSLEAFQDIFWIAAVASLAAAAVALALPSSQRVAAGAPAEAVTPEPAKGIPEGEVKGEGREHEIVVRGVVLRDDRRPIRHAVVTVLSTEGEPVDWSRADNEGSYSVVLPGPGRYVVVSSAEGWAPRSEILEFTDAATKQHIRLTEPLSLCGTITTTGRPLKRALVSVTRPTGDSVAIVRTDEAGRYQIPVPPTGRYILTVVDPHTQWVRSRQVPIIAAQSNTVDIDVESDDLSVSTPHVLPGVGL
jgi:MFS family permease